MIEPVSLAYGYDLAGDRSARDHAHALRERGSRRQLLLDHDRVDRSRRQLRLSCRIHAVTIPHAAT
jgi:hypothetical protein